MPSRQHSAESQSPLIDEDALPIKKSSPSLSSSGGPGSDYRLVVGDDMDKRAVQQDLRAGIAYGPARSPVDLLMNHPALPVMCYCAASIVMTVVNKFVVSGSHFAMNFLLLAIQSVVCVACVMVSKHFGLITFRDFDANDARRWFPISFLLVSVIYTGSKSLQFLSIPIYTIFKNMTIILIAYGEVLWFGGHVTALTLVSFGLMVLSSMTAAWGDISKGLSTSPSAVTAPTTNSVGYAWMIINCFVSAGYVLAMRKRIKVTNFRDWDTMFYNNLLSIPVLVFCSITMEDWSYAGLSRNFPEDNRKTLLSAMCFSGAAAVFISYTTAWCVRTTSSTTFSMVGALNKLPVAASGLIFFGDPATLQNVTAIFIGFLAGIVFSAAKSAQAAKAKLLPGNTADLGMVKPRQ